MSGPSAEDDLIATLFAPVAGPGGLGLKDDVACYAPPPGCDVVATKDAIVAGVHFFPDDAPEDVARKALRVNVSDLAAKGADPTGFLLAIALPKGLAPDWLARFAQALAEDAATYACPLLGGDTVSTPGPLTLSITALGAVPHGALVARTGVRAGDALYVSGTIGDAALGLGVRQGAPWSRDIDPADRAHLLDRYLRPQPRHALRAALRAFASGAMDVSDGLVGDVAKMLRASGVGGRIDLDLAPLSAAARAATSRDEMLFETAVTGGDDFEIVCAVAPDSCPAFERAAGEAGVPVTRIGAAEAAEALFTRGGRRIQYARQSYSHV